EAGERAVELVVVGAVVLHGAAGLVRDRHDAVHVRILLEEVSLPEALGDVLARAGGAVDGADDGDVVARTVAAVAAVVAHPGARLGPGRWGRAVAAEGVVALEIVRRDVMNVDVTADGNVLAGEADDLAVFVNRFAFLDGPQRDFVAHADTRFERDRLAVDLKLRSGDEMAGGDGDVIFGAQLHGDLGERDGWHTNSLQGEQRRRQFC